LLYESLRLIVDSLRKKQLSKADEAGDFDPAGSEEGACTTEEKESSLAASSSLSLIGDSTLGGGGGGVHHHVPTSSYVNASTVVAAALAAAAAQRSAAKATSATAPLPATSTASGPPVSSHHDHHCQKTEGRWRPGSWLRRSFVLLWRRRASPASATAAVTASCAKPLLQDDIMSIIAYHQAKASKQCRPPGANILLLGECVLEGVLTEWLGPGGLGGSGGAGVGGGGSVCTPPPPSASSTSSAFSVPGLLVLQDNPQWARSRLLLMRTSAGYVLEVYTPPEFLTLALI
uniref:Pecanex-like protein n=1 Tax=Hydatigena taeniaeformis TaxID=6205 RepID=A0A0R3WUX3_HYDTA